MHCNQDATEKLNLDLVRPSGPQFPLTPLVRYYRSPTRGVCFHAQPVEGPFPPTSSRPCVFSRCECSYHRGYRHQRPTSPIASVSDWLNWNPVWHGIFREVAGTTTTVACSVTKQRTPCSAHVHRVHERLRACMGRDGGSLCMAQSVSSCGWEPGDLECSLMT